MRVQLIIAGMFTMACASGQRGESAAPRPARSSTITAERIADAHAANVWELLRLIDRRYYYAEDRYGRAVAIRSHRGPASLVMRSSDMPLVVLDGARLVDVTVLQQISTEGVRSIDFIDGMSGTTFFGTNSGAGVIYIHSQFTPDR